MAAGFFAQTDNITILNNTLLDQLTHYFASFQDERDKITRVCHTIYHICQQVNWVPFLGHFSSECAPDGARILAEYFLPNKFIHKSVKQKFHSAIAALYTHLQNKEQQRQNSYLSSIINRPRHPIIQQFYNCFSHFWPYIQQNNQSYSNPQFINLLVALQAFIDRYNQFLSQEYMFGGQLITENILQICQHNVLIDKTSL
jgi:hypothetical protein